MDKMKTILLIIPLCFISLFLLSFPALTQNVVVASTSLTGAIVRAATGKEVRVLAPSEMRHPPEYDLKPSDLLKFEGADVVVYAGYEKMVPRLLETSRNRNILAIRIETSISPEDLIKQARRISGILKTEREEEAWEAGFLEKLRNLQRRLSPFSGHRAVVHKFAEPFAQWAGLSIVQMINPGELTPKVIAEAIAKKPKLVVDIYHFPIAEVIAENAKCGYIQVINFPGAGNTKTLEDLFEYNFAQLRKTMQ
jgi:zinc transport system substrate-binding protein